MNPAGPFWRKLRETYDARRADEGYVARARLVFADRSPVTRAAPRRIPWRLAIAIAASLAGATSGVYFLASKGAGDLRFSVLGDAGRAGSWIDVPSTNPIHLAFSDGSTFRLAAGSRASVRAVDPNGARIVVQRGAASASVVHRSASHWLLDVGPFEVTVVGTRFDVSWEPASERFTLSLDEGSVVVRGGCLADSRAVAAGHALDVSCKQGQIVETWAQAPHGEAVPAAPSGGNADGGLAATVASAETASADATRAPRASSPSEVPRAAAVLHSPAWRDLTAAGRFREALALVEHRGFGDVCRTASGADLLDLGDVARLAGDSPHARQAYEAARGKLQDDDRSAYSLGLTAFDQDRDFALAARWFETYLSEQPNGRLRREAEGRLMEALQRAGQSDKARAVAERYLREYPEGTHALLARQIVAR